MCTPPLFAPTRWMAEPIPSLPPLFPPPEISSFWGTSIAITPSATQEVLLTPERRKYSTGSSPLTSSPSITMTHPPFSIAPLAVAPSLTSPLLTLLLPFLAPGMCFRTWVLTIYQFFYPSLSLRLIAPTSVNLPSIFYFQKSRWDDARLALPLTDVMKNARLTYPLLDVPLQSSPKLRHGRRLALLLHPNLILNLYILFFALSLAFLPRPLPLLISPTVLLPGN